MQKPSSACWHQALRCPFSLFSHPAPAILHHLPPCPQPSTLPSSLPFSLDSLLYLVFIPRLPPSVYKLCWMFPGLFLLCSYALGKAGLATKPSTTAALWRTESFSPALKAEKTQSKRGQLMLALFRCPYKAEGYKFTSQALLYRCLITLPGETHSYPDRVQAAD